jgi:hypothetical protein
MPLKPDRVENQYGYDIRNYMYNANLRGGVASVVTAGSGGSPGNPSNVCDYVSNPSGAIPLGILLADCVGTTIDQTRFHLNFYKEQFPSGGKAPLDAKGRYTTNSIYGTPSVGPAYLHSGGNVSSTQLTGAPQVGKFLTTLDEDGYATIQMNVV